MAMIELLPNPLVLPSTLDDNQDVIKIVHEHPIPSNNESNYSLMTDETDSSSNLNIENDNGGKKSKHSVIVSYGPIGIKVRQYAAPTLATGRRSKFTKLEGDAAIKRELRRKRNREAARKLKEKRGNIEQQLEKEIHELEFKEQILLTKIDSLKFYKEHLKIQCQNVVSVDERLARTTSSTLLDADRNRRRVDRNVPVHGHSKEVKTEPRSPSPQWQLVFGI